VRLKKQPYAPNEANKEKANADEQNLKWQLKNVNRVRPTTVEADMVKSALLYMAVAAHVVDLQHQVKVYEKMGRDPKRLKYAMKRSRFVVNTYNPRSVHVRRSTYGVEAVLLRQKRPLSELASEFPDVEKLKSKEDKLVTYNDFTDLEDRCIWVSDYDFGSPLVILMKPSPHELDFFPWIAMMGGSTLEDEPQYQYHPMLFSIYQQGAWDAQNIVGTLMMSDTIARSAGPRYAEEGPMPDSITDINYTAPTQIAKVTPGNALRELAQRPVDPALTQVYQWLSGNNAKSTVSRVLQGGDMPAGVTAFSSINLLTQTAVGALKPAKALAERGLSEMFTLMLHWTKHTGTPLYAYGTGKKDYGTNYVINADEIDPGAIYLEVSLTPDVPVDRLQQANAAQMLSPFGYPNERVLEDVGVDDASEAMQTWYIEQRIKHLFEMEKQADMTQMQMGARMAMQEQQQEAQMEAQQEAMQGPIPGGPGFAPRQGGSSPVMAAGPTAALQAGLPGQEEEQNPLAGLA
jgi:hypothetical protein